MYIRPIILLHSVLLLLLVSCGGGGGGGNTAGGGIGGTGQGVITGFGSIIIGGDEFEIASGAQITIDDQSGKQQSDLRVGMVIDYTFNTGNQLTVVTYFNDAEGPISGVDPATSSFVVLGRTVFVDGQTTIIGVQSFGDLAANNVVEVSGFPDSNGAIRATGIWKKSDAPGAGTSSEVKGYIANLVNSVSTKTFTINGQLVDFSQANSVVGTLAEGALVEVKGTLSGTTLIANSVEVKTSGVSGGGDGGGGDGGGGGAGQQAEVEGLITQINSATDFVVNGQRVIANASTRYVGGTPEALLLNNRVKVQGSLNSSNILVATSIEFRATIEIEARASAKGADTLSFFGASGGVVVTVTASTRIEDKRDDDPDLTLAEIEANPSTGDYLEVEAERVGGDFIATRIEREDTPSNGDVVLRGVVDTGSVANPDFKILGVSVSTSASTQFRSDVNSAVDTQSEFFSALRAGQDVVKATGPFNGSAIVADEVEIELDD